jgi:hypothetical protein
VTLCAESRSDRVHVEVRHRLLLCEIVDREVLVADDHTDLTLTRVASHHPAEAPSSSSLLASWISTAVVQQ